MNNNNNNKEVMPYITIKPGNTKKNIPSGKGAMYVSVFAVMMLVAAYCSFSAAPWLSVLCIFMSFIFAIIGLVMCSNVRKFGGRMAYAKVIATIGYIVCLLIIIVACIAGACVMTLGSCACGIMHE